MCESEVRGEGRRTKRREWRSRIKDGKERRKGRSEGKEESRDKGWNGGRNEKEWEGMEGRKAREGRTGGIGCQPWRPRAILVSRTAGVPVAGHPVLAPLGRPGTRPEGPSPSDPRLGTLVKE